MEEAVMTQIESLYHTENSHHYQHPFSGQYSAYSLPSTSAIPSFSDCLVQASLMLAQYSSWERAKG